MFVNGMVGYDVIEILDIVNKLNSVSKDLKHLTDLHYTKSGYDAYVGNIIYRLALRHGVDEETAKLIVDDWNIVSAQNDVNEMIKIDKLLENK